VSDGYLFDYVFSFRDVRVERQRDPFRGIEKSLRDLSEMASEKD